MTSKNISYKKPPVREALVDIRFESLPSDFLPKIEAAHEDINKDYPTKRTAYALEGSWEMQNSTLIPQQKSSRAVGYHFLSPDEKQVIQFRLDGFTFNLLKPNPEESWQGWESIRRESLKAWQLFSKAVNPKEISRLGVRYINQIVIRAPKVNLDEYFSAPPQIPKKFLHQILEDYFSRVAIPIKAATAIVIHAPGPALYPDSVTVILDIDVFYEHKMASDDNLLWEKLDQLRDIKNEIFDVFLKEKAKDLFK